MNIQISETFKNLMPSLTEEEYNNLEQSIVTEGCRDALVLWNGYLIDGHNRYEICKKQNIPFTTSEKFFDNEHDVINWIIDNQLSRRNITDDQRAYLIGKRYKEEKKAIGEKVAVGFERLKQLTPSDTIAAIKQSLPNLDKNGGNSYHESRRNLDKTETKIAEQSKVSPKTVRNAEKFADAVDKVAENTGINPQKILSGQISATRKDIQDVSKLEPEIQKKVFEKIEKKEVKTVKDAVKEVKKEELEELKTVEEIEPKKEVIKCEYGKWYKLGDHLLYCGSNNDESFLNGLKEHPASFAFADPPYNADVAEWDSNFTWSQDWLIDYAPIVAVTPGIVSIYDFMNSTSMPYSWSVACWIDNGMTRGALGFGNWIYIALFSKESLYRNSQDFLKVTISNSETKETTHKGRKPASLIAWLFERFSKASDNIIDPFLGSGTSLLIAEKMDRCCIGAEINPEYCEAIISRWEQMTGEKVSVYED